MKNTSLGKDISMRRKKPQDLIFSAVNRKCMSSHSLKYPRGTLLLVCVGLSCPVICVYPEQREIMKSELLTEARPESVGKHWGITAWTRRASCKTHTRTQNRNTHPQRPRVSHASHAHLAVMNPSTVTDIAPSRFRTRSRPSPLLRSQSLLNER